MFTRFALSLLLAGSLYAQKITTISLPDAKVEAPYRFQLQGEGGKKPYKWFSASSLPTGISLDISGVLVGTPTVPGSFLLALRMVTANNKTTSKTLTLTVTPKAPPPAPLTITCAPPGFKLLPDGRCQIVGPNPDGSFPLGTPIP